MIARDIIQWSSLAISACLMGIAALITIRIALIASSLKRRLPFVPTDYDTRRFMVDQIPAPARVIIDLGSGNGTLLARVTKKFPRADVRGVEMNGILYWISRARLSWGRHAPTMIREDFFQTDIHDADVVLGFWIDTVMDELLEKFIRECKTGCVIISNAVPLPESTYFSEQVYSVPRRLFGPSRVYVYTKNASSASSISSHL